MCKIYDPAITVTEGPDYLTWEGRLSRLFKCWEDNGTSCLEQVGEGKRDIRAALKKHGTYRIYGFVGCHFDLTVVEE